MKDTFSLTAVHERASRTPKLPLLGSSTSLNSFRLTSGTPKNSDRLSKNRKKLNSAKLSDTHELLNSIEERATKEIEDLFCDQKSAELLETVNKLETSKYVKEIVNNLHEHVQMRKRDYNKLCFQKEKLKQEIRGLKERLSDIEAPLKINEFHEEKLEKLSLEKIEMEKKITEEKMYSQTLKHMIDVRMKDLASVVDPTRQVRKELMETYTKKATIDRETEYHCMEARIQQAELHRIQETFNEQREDMREIFNKELEKFQDRSKALAFYKENQKLWYNERKVDEQDLEIKALEELETDFAEEISLRDRLVKAEEQLESKETYVAQALNSTNTSSLDELGEGIEKLKETRTQLINLQKDLENTLNRQSEETLQLNKDLDKILLEKHQRDSSDYHVLYELEEKIALKEKKIEELVEYLETVDTDSSAVVLGFNRLIEKISDATGDQSARGVRSVKEALEYLLGKIEDFRAYN